MSYLNPWSTCRTYRPLFSSFTLKSRHLKVNHLSKQPRLRTWKMCTTSQRHDKQGNRYWSFQKMRGFLTVAPLSPAFPSSPGFPGSPWMTHRHDWDWPTFRPRQSNGRLSPSSQEVRPVRRLRPHHFRPGRREKTEFNSLQCEQNVIPLRFLPHSPSHQGPRLVLVCQEAPIMWDH